MWDFFRVITLFFNNNNNNNNNDNDNINNNNNNKNKFTKNWKCQ